MLKTNFGKNLVKYQKLTEERDKICQESPIDTEKLDKVNRRINNHVKKYGTGATTNCQTCVVAYLLQTQGINAYPLPNDNVYYQSDLGVFSLIQTDDPYNPWDTGKFYLDENGNTLSMWKNQPPIMVHDGVGRCMVINERVKLNEIYELDLCFENGAHAVICGRDKKGLYIFDPQCDKEYRGEEFFQLIDKAQSKEQWNYFVLMRIDNCTVNWDIVSKIVEIRPSKK